MNKLCLAALISVAFSTSALAANRHGLTVSPQEETPVAAVWHFSNVSEDDLPDSHRVRVDTTVLGFGSSGFQCNDCPAERMSSGATPPLQVFSVSIRF